MPQRQTGGSRQLIWPNPSTGEYASSRATPIPYNAQAKQEQNEIAARYSDVYRQQIDRSQTPLKIAVQLAIAGNVIDLGVKSGLKSSQIEFEIAHALEMPLVGDVEQFADAVQAAQCILYLTDNAGEIVFDRLLIEQLPCERITVAVCGEGGL